MSVSAAEFHRLMVVLAKWNVTSRMPGFNCDVIREV